MKIPFRERRKFTFSNKCITPEIIRQISNVINGEIQQIKSPQNDIMLFTVDAEDDSSYESQSPDIFSEGLFLDRKAIQKITMRFTLADCSKNIEVQILQTQDSNKENYVMVSGDNPTWVNGILAQLTEIIHSSDKHPQFIAWLGWFVFALVVAFEGIIINLTDKMPKGSHPVEAILLMIGLLGSPVYANYLYEHYLKTLWPSVELQTGPTYLQIPLQKRKQFYWVMGAIIVPLVVAALYDLLKSGLLGT